MAEGSNAPTSGRIRVGVGGWTFAPWRGVFYPPGLTQKRELEFASRALTSIEINGTFYSTFKPDTWAKWRDETPDGFVFSVKASRFCTNRKALASGGESIARFIGQGMSALGDKLGPINWQLAATKLFDPDDVAAFLDLLPKEVDGLPLRHALEVRHPSFEAEAFYDLARAHGVDIICAMGEDHPAIDQPTADFTYARVMTSREDLDEGLTAAELDGLAHRARGWSEHGDVLVYFISAAKVRNPAAAQALIRRLG